MDSTSMVSVRSSIYETVEENGRTYHRFKEGSMFELKMKSNVRHGWFYADLDDI